ncbi:hypothetical protein PMI16_01938 [Herbaspirillum sp. CF444]|uniref:hypothetical protein n=1 Tax=Herbaspirillum sp. CF444 TaxID=1144319 RepID=UPI0002724BC0|nr:hypothetical protein [Herbaspirillum sp. CF444]EJL89746.1 hypothetical protein PMI16_01938 [Herbaspirillum sp. CF444]
MRTVSRSKWVLPGLFLILLSGCETPAALKSADDAAAKQMAVDAGSKSGGGNQNQSGGQDKDAGGAKKNMLDVTPMSTFFDLDSEAPIAFTDAYTRLRIDGGLQESQGAAAGANGSLSYAQRGLIERYLLSIKYDVNVLAKVKIGTYEESVSLATLSSTSGSDGQSWTRDVVHNASSFPWFLVKEGGVEGTPRVSVEFNASRTVDSGVAGNALQITLTAIRALAPTSNVVTRLSEGATKDKAQAIDTAVSKLFFRKLSEKHTSDRDFLRWQDGGGMAITINIPEKEGDWNGNIRPMGVWRIGFDAPRPSVFSDWRYCKKESPTQRCKTDLKVARKAVVQEKDASKILAFVMLKASSNVTTIRDHLQQQPWYGTALSSLGNDDKANSQILNGMCQNIVQEMIGQSFSALDARLVAWAVVTGTHPAAKLTEKAWSAACKDVKDWLASQ